jgi:hypothetical protein
MPSTAIHVMRIFSLPILPLVARLYYAMTTYPLLLPLESATAPLRLVLLAAAAPLLPLLVPLAGAALTQLLCLAFPVSLG